MAGEWLTTQTYNGGAFIELVQPVSGQSMFHDYLAQHPAGGTQHIAFRLPVRDFDRVISNLREQGYAIISEVDHPIARLRLWSRSGGECVVNGKVSGGDPKRNL